jgi:alkylation response protein AidB-like acyl-CoA dehydrogenase
MDFQLNEDQEALVGAVQAILADHAALPQSARMNFNYFDAALQRQLLDAGFLDAGRVLGALEATLVVIEAARIPAVVELAASALVAPKLFPDEHVPGPVALVRAADIGKPIRNLAVAATVLVDLGEEVALLPLAQGDAVPVDTVFGYPYGRFAATPDLSGARRIPAGPNLRQWWRVALAAEFAGASQAAIAFTVDYVLERQVFGHPVGVFQSVQHRLAQCHQIAMGIKYLALRAAWSGEAVHADMAACFAQQHVRKLMFDLHQFNGAMGVTNEHSLHFWTYRMRALQAEVGGAYGSAVDVARQLWGAASQDPARSDFAARAA